LFHVGREEAEAWKVVVSNDDHDAQMIIPFSVSMRLALNAGGKSNCAKDVNHTKTIRRMKWQETCVKL